ncbi:hypothetical protein WL29_22290 [Burkholderia ubonensis]|uniref:Uncharacterized protein n=1 Tax=Burkholderia ubonensis TaxID=101571 RepID=A0A106QDB3_9BURK|nr:hypothetical protein [Burkholderia ubonensis]KWA84097.1 hypothetical protein WL29_22290 [Burkholderia ubonensis]
MKFFIIGAVYGPILLAMVGGYLRYKAVSGFQATLRENLDYRAFRRRIKFSPYARRYKLGMALIIGAPLVTLIGIVLLRLTGAMAA